MIRSEYHLTALATVIPGPNRVNRLLDLLATLSSPQIPTANVAEPLKFRGNQLFWSDGQGHSEYPARILGDAIKASRLVIPCFLIIELRDFVADD